MTETKSTQKWLDELVLELRLLNVPGDQIGDAVGSVTEHLADSGESADAAFGDPAGYARALGLERPAPAGFKSAIAVNLLGLLGFMVLIMSAAPAAAGTPLRITMLNAGLVLFSLVALLVVVLNLSAVVRLKIWQAGVLGAAVAVALSVLAVLLPDTSIAIVPALPLAVAGGLVTLGAACWAQFYRKEPHDPVLDPLSSNGATKSGIFVATVGNWLLVLGALVLVPATIALERF